MLCMRSGVNSTGVSGGGAPSGGVLMVKPSIGGGSPGGGGVGAERGPPNKKGAPPSAKLGESAVQKNLREFIVVPPQSAPQSSRLAIYVSAKVFSRSIASCSVSEKEASKP